MHCDANTKLAAMQEAARQGEIALAKAHKEYNASTHVSALSHVHCRLVASQKTTSSLGDHGQTANEVRNLGIQIESLTAVRVHSSNIT